MSVPDIDVMMRRQAEPDAIARVETIVVTECHEVVTEGRLTGAQFKGLIVDALRRSLCPGLAQDVDFELTIGTMLMPTTWPEVRFTATQDVLALSVKPKIENITVSVHHADSARGSVRRL